MKYDTSPTLLTLCATALILAGLSSAQAQQRRAPAPVPKATPTPVSRPVQIFGPSQSSNVSATPASPARTAPARSPQAHFFRAIQQANHTVTTLDGSRNALNQLLADDRPTVFLFWATWCHVCHTAFEDWQAVYERYARQGLNVIALNVQDPVESAEVKSFLREQRLSFPVYFAPRALHAQMTEGRLGTPMTFVFDREGNLAARFVGWTRGQGRQALENVARGVLSE